VVAAMGSPQSQVLKQNDAKDVLEEVNVPKDTVDAHSQGLVDVARLQQLKASILLSGRYTRSRPLEADYELLPQICGTGVDGDVRLARSRDGRPRAVKSFDLSSLLDRKKQDLAREVNLALSLDHPHIARFENVYESPNELHLVMEHMAGGELFTHLRIQGQLSEAKSADVTHQMLSAVAYLHKQGIVHRDLKLENWLYERPDKKHLKLIDFGIAKLWDRSEPMHRVCGSPSYMAPEVLKGSYTEKADIWSLGVTTYALLTGRALFMGQSDQDILRKVKACRPDWSSAALEALSQETQEFVRALICKDPAVRLSSDAALKHRWITSHKVADPVPIDAGVARSVASFSKHSHFKRACLFMMAWSPSHDDLQDLRRQFLTVDKECRGSITVQQLRKEMETNCSSDTLETTVLNDLDTACEEELSFSEFVAAAMDDRIASSDDALLKAFRRFDTIGKGIIAVENLRTVLGDSFEGLDIEDVFHVADKKNAGSFQYEDFSSFLRCPDAQAYQYKSLDEMASMQDVHHLANEKLECARAEQDVHNARAESLQDSPTMLCHTSKATSLPDVRHLAQMHADSLDHSTAAPGKTEDLSVVCCEEGGLMGSRSASVPSSLSAAGFRYNVPSPSTRPLNVPYWRNRQFQQPSPGGLQGDVRHFSHSGDFHKTCHQSAIEPVDAVQRQIAVH
jgi:calcium-dependent protein kinase